MENVYELLIYNSVKGNPDKFQLIILGNTNSQNMKFSFKGSSVNVIKSAGNWDLVTFTEEILNGKLHFLCSDTVFCYKKHKRNHSQ